MDLDARFQAYANLSVTIDRYYNAVGAFAGHYESFRTVNDALAALPGRLPEHLQNDPYGQACFQAMCVFNYAATTGLFARESNPFLKDLQFDLRKYAYATCFNYQWCIFEEYTREVVFALIAEGRVGPALAKSLERQKRNTGAFQALIEQEGVLGESPFRAILPGDGWLPEIQEVGYDKLTEIRERRNKLIHSPTAFEDSFGNLPGAVSASEHAYYKTMWILRKFGERVWLLAKSKASP